MSPSNVTSNTASKIQLKATGCPNWKNWKNKFWLQIIYPGLCIGIESSHKRHVKFQIVQVVFDKVNVERLFPVKIYMQLSHRGVNPLPTTLKEYVSAGISHPVFYGDIVYMYKLRSAFKGAANFLSRLPRKLLNAFGVGIMTN